MNGSNRAMKLLAASDKIDHYIDTDPDQFDNAEAVDLAATNITSALICGLKSAALEALGLLSTRDSKQLTEIFDL